MNDPERLIQGGDDLERAMLQAGARDGPPAASRQQAAAALGIGGGGAAVGALSLGSGWSLLKWIGGATIAAALVGGGLHFLRSAPTASMVIAPPATPVPVPTIAPAPEPLPVLEPAPTATDPMPAVPKMDRARSAPSKTKRTSTLELETSLLDTARGALREGHPESALRTLDTYDAQFPAGLLSPEATVLRIEALVRVGDEAGARKLADTFLRAHPESPLAARVRSLGAGSGSDKTVRTNL